MKLLKKSNSIAKKMFWSVAPLVWGGLTWFLAYGPGNLVPLSRQFRLLLGLATLSYFFYQTLNKAERIRVTFFGYPLIIPSWSILVSSAVALLVGTLFVPSLNQWPFIPSIIFIVFADAYIEELITHSYFIQYRMTTLEFLFFNTVSSAAFTLMHAGYTPYAQSLSTLFFVNGHFAFSFMLGIITYRTGRIEIPMLMHSSSNLLRYAIPQVLLHRQIPFIMLMYTCVEYLLLAGATKKEPAAKKY